MRIFVVTSGSHGDVHPFLALGRELSSRGHEVLLFTHPFFEKSAAAAGLELVPICAEIDLVSVLEDPRLMKAGWGTLRVIRMVAQSARSAVGTLRDAISDRRPDLILSHHICLGARWLAEELSIPCAVAQLAPPFWFSPEDPVPAPQHLPGRFREWLARRVVRHLWKPMARSADWPTNILRRRLGFPPEIGGFRYDLHGKDLGLGLWSEHFRAPTPSDPPQCSTCGFTWHDRGPDAATENRGLEQFLDSREPVVFTLGTAAIHTGLDFLRTAKATCAELGRPGLLLAGPFADRLGDLGGEIFVADYAPFSAVLPRACATVHHGGIGTTAQSLRAGRPTVAVPHAHDQFNNALRTEHLGTGQVVPRSRLSVERLASALDLVLSDRALRARAAEIGRALEGEDGAVVAVDEIEALSKRARPGPPLA